MLVTLKTLQQQTFKVEVDPEDTVLRLKEKIAVEKGEEYAVGNQKLIYAGKILDDSQKINFYKIEEKNFVVIMVTQPKQSNVTPAPAARTPAVEVPAVAAPAESITTPDPSVPVAAETAESALVTGETFEKAVKEIVDMGFERDLVLRAMSASYNNPDRAVEYLLSGTLPEENIGLDRPTNPSVPIPNVALPTGTATTGGDDPLAFMMSQPQFQQMRSLIQSNPELLPTILQQISTSNPRLMQIITENQDRFVQMLNEPLPPAGGVGSASPPSQPSFEAPAGGESSYIQVTPDERLAIERLKALGFPESMCLQAYFACDKNEDLAANFLLSQDFDDFYEQS